MDFKFLEIGTRIAIGQFDATIIEYDVLDGFSGLFPVYVVRFDTGETEPVHHTDITGLIYDNPMPIEVIEARKAYRAARSQQLTTARENEAKQAEEIKRLRATLESIASNAPQEELTELTGKALAQAREFYYAGILAKKTLGHE